MREGLCNRLKSWVSSYRLDEDVKVYWPVNYYSGCSFHDLWENDIEYPVDPGRSNTPQYQIHGSWRFQVFPSDGLPFRRIDWLLQDTPQNMKDIYVPLIKRIQPIQYIQNEVDQWAGKIDDKTVLCAVRTWIGTDRSFDINVWFRKMDTIADEKNIFLMCDSTQYAEQFIQRYGKRIWFRPKRTFWGDRVCTEGMQDITIDLYLGSKCKTMFLAWHSAFTEYMYFLGECKATHVETVGEFEHLPSRRPRDPLVQFKARELNRT